MMNNQMKVLIKLIRNDDDNDDEIEGPDDDIRNKLTEIFLDESNFASDEEEEYED